VISLIGDPHLIRPFDMPLYIEFLDKEFELIFATGVFNDFSSIVNSLFELVFGM
jgi:hypothetical protein